MKTIFVFFLFFFPFLATAQNYNNIVSPGMTYYGDDSDYLRGYRYDSVRLSGTDSIFYAPQTIIRNISGCSDTSYGPVLSMITVKKNDGWFDLKDLNAQSSNIKSTAVLNESWVVRSTPGNNHIEAKVTDIRLDSVVDTVDMIKEITFNLKDQGGNLVNHPINGKKILLSQHYGFATTFDWSHFPDDIKIWTLMGKDEAGIGVQDLTIPERFDFQPGDVFNYLYLEGYVGFTPTEITKTIETILSRKDSTGSVIYTIEKCELTVYPYYNTTTSTWDTISSIVNFNDPELKKQIEPIPDYFIVTGNLPVRSAAWYSRPRNGFHGMAAKEYSRKGYLFNQNCWEFSAEDSAFQYAAGLGISHFIDIDYEGWPTSGPYSSEKRLVYYKKGNEEWGTPLSTGCDALVPVTEIKKSEFLIAPNPFTTQTEVKLTVTPHSPMKYQLIDLVGCTVQTSHFEGNEFVINRNGLSSGIYLLVVYDKNGEITIKTKLIIQ